MGTITEAIVKMPEHFRERGYQTYDNFISDFFIFSQSNDIEWDINNLEAVIRPIFLKNKTDYKSFHGDFIKFFKFMDCVVVTPEVAADIKKRENKKKDIENKIKKLSKKIDKKEDNDKDNKKFDKIYKRVKQQYAEMTKDMPEMRDFNNIPHDTEKLKKLLTRAVKYKNYENIFKFIELLNKKINKEKNRLKEKTEKENAEKEREKLQKKLDTLSVKEIIKTAPVLKHRREFVGKNAIKSHFKGELFDKQIAQLDENDKRLIEEYIKENARKFRTRLARKIKTNQKRKLDLPATCKMACRTNGIPMDLRFIKPKRNKSRLVMFLDISGSCSSASKLLLTFMHQMKSVFTNGCETFVFVNSLFDVSSSFNESNSADEFIEMVFDTIPVRGVYSDYYRPLETFRKEYFSKLTKDSVVFFMGDARNNKNETGEEFVKAIARKAKKTYWLNTESKEQWNKADSIIDVYGQYMNEVKEIITVADLLNFLTEVG